MTRKQGAYILSMVFLYVAVVLPVTALFAARLGVQDMRLDLVSMVYGDAYKPYAYRVLLPGAIRGVVVISESLFALSAVERAESPIGRLGSRVLRDIGAPDEAMSFGYEYGLFFIIACCCFLGFGFVLRALTKLTYPDYPRYVADFAPIVGILVIPVVFYRYSNLVHDPTTLLLFTLCVYLISRRALIAYLFMFPLAVLNKETAILLTIVFILREAGFSTIRRLISVTAYLFVVFVVIRLLLMYGYAENPGTSVEMHFADNLRLMGELGFYIVSDNSIAPYRLHIRPPTLINLTALQDMVIGWKVADIITTFGSIDVCLGEIDR